MIGESDTLNPASLLDATTISVQSFPLKRLFDVVFSALALVVGFPVFALIAMAIKLTSKGPVLFVDKRVGRGGKIFNCYKFRTMCPKAAQELDELLQNNPAFQKEWNERRKLQHDPRVTTFGRLLRRTSLDELPQFWNVLKGDLSVVGPRPVTDEEMTRCYGFKARKILEVRPGITGVWQTQGRSDTTYDERIAMDEQYVDTRTFGLDLLLVLKTIPAVLRSRGAY